MVRFTNSTYIFPVYIEKPIETYSHKATANPGESFISKDGVQWDDLTLHHPNSNVCIKGYSSTPNTPKPIISCNTWKEFIKVWMINKTYYVISITLENPDVFPEGFRLAIYRQLDGGVFEDRKDITNSDIQDGNFTFYDLVSEDASQCNYHATAFDSLGYIIAHSGIQYVQ